MSDEFCRDLSKLNKNQDFDNNWQNLSSAAASGHGPGQQQQRKTNGLCAATLPQFYFAELPSMGHAMNGSSTKEAANARLHLARALYHAPLELLRLRLLESGITVPPDVVLSAALSRAASPNAPYSVQLMHQLTNFRFHLPAVEVARAAGIDQSFDVRFALYPVPAHAPLSLAPLERGEKLNAAVAALLAKAENIALAAHLQRALTPLMAAAALLLVRGGFGLVGSAAYLLHAAEAPHASYTSVRANDLDIIDPLWTPVTETPNQRERRRGVLVDKVHEHVKQLLGGVGGVYKRVSATNKCITIKYIDAESGAAVLKVDVCDTSPQIAAAAPLGVAFNVLSSLDASSGALVARAWKVDPYCADPFDSAEYAALITQTLAERRVDVRVEQFTEGSSDERQRQLHRRAVAAVARGCNVTVSNVSRCSPQRSDARLLGTPFNAFHSAVRLRVREGGVFLTRVSEELKDVAAIRSLFGVDLVAVSLLGGSFMAGLTSAANGAAADVAQPSEDEPALQKRRRVLVHAADNDDDHDAVALAVEVEGVSLVVADHVTSGNAASDGLVAKKRTHSAAGVDTAAAAQAGSTTTTATEDDDGDFTNDEFADDDDDDIASRGWAALTVDEQLKRILRRCWRARAYIRANQRLPMPHTVRLLRFVFAEIVAVRQRLALPVESRAVLCRFVPRIGSAPRPFAFNKSTFATCVVTHLYVFVGLAEGGDNAGVDANGFVRIDGKSASMKRVLSEMVWLREEEKRERRFACGHVEPPPVLNADEREAFRSDRRSFVLALARRRINALYPSRPLHGVVERTAAFVTFCTTSMHLTVSKSAEKRDRALVAKQRNSTAPQSPSAASTKEDVPAGAAKRAKRAPKRLARRERRAASESAFAAPPLRFVGAPVGAIVEPTPKPSRVFRKEHTSAVTLDQIAGMIKNGEASRVVLELVQNTATEAAVLTAEQLRDELKRQRDAAGEPTPTALTAAGSSLAFVRDRIAELAPDVAFSQVFVDPGARNAALLVNDVGDSCVFFDINANRQYLLDGNKRTPRTKPKSGVQPVAKSKRFEDELLDLDVEDEALELDELLLDEPPPLPLGPRTKPPPDPDEPPDGQTDPPPEPPDDTAPPSSTSTVPNATDKYEQRESLDGNQRRQRYRQNLVDLIARRCVDNGARRAIVYLGRNHLPQMGWLVVELVKLGVLVVLIDECGSSASCSEHQCRMRLLELNERRAVCETALEALKAQIAASTSSTSSATSAPPPSAPRITRKNVPLLVDDAPLLTPDAPFESHVCKPVATDDDDWQFVKPAAAAARGGTGDRRQQDRLAFEPKELEQSKPYAEALGRAAQKDKNATFDSEHDQIPLANRGRSAMKHLGDAAAKKCREAAGPTLNMTPAQRSALKKRCCVAWLAAVAGVPPDELKLRVGLSPDEVLKKAKFIRSDHPEHNGTERDVIGALRAKFKLVKATSFSIGQLKRRQNLWIKRARCDSCATKAQRCRQCLGERALRHLKLDCAGSGLCACDKARKPASLNGVWHVPHKREQWSRKVCDHDGGMHEIDRDLNAVYNIAHIVRVENQFGGRAESHCHRKRSQTNVRRTCSATTGVPEPRSKFM